MERKILLVLALGLTIAATAQTKTIQERLGYSKETKLLIIHADDIGVSHSENLASIQVMEKGVVNSGSIMVPCPWFPEIANYARNHPDKDFGLHLTLTSEWKFYKWGPVLSAAKVSSLVDPQGYFYATTPLMLQKVKAAEVESELRAQIEMAKASGIDPTHFDAHMAGPAAGPELLKAYLKLGHEYKVPLLLNNDIAKQFQIDLKKFINDKDVVVDKVIMAELPDYKGGMENYYVNQIKGLQPGLSIILLHAAYDNEEMRAVTVEHVAYGAQWRQYDVNFFTGDKCKALLESENIKLVTWKEIRDKVVRN